MYQVQPTVKAIERMGFHPYIRNIGGKEYVAVSAEYGDDAADYYGEYRGGYPWINPKLERLAEQKKAYWEWENPGSLTLFPV